MRCAGFVTLVALAVLLPATPTHGQSSARAERSTLELVRDGVIAIEEGKFFLAQNHFAEAAEIDPHLTQAHFGLGLAALGDDDRRDTERSLTRALETSAGAAEVRYALGIAAFAFDDRRRAAEHLRAAAETDKFFLEAHYALAIVAALDGDLEAAESGLRQAIRIDGRHAAAHFQLGAILARRGDLDGSLAEFSRSMIIAPDLSEARAENLILFTRRAIPPQPPEKTLEMPLPVLRPSLEWAPWRGSSRRSRDSGSSTSGEEIPEWYLYYMMALHLEDAGHWQGAADMLERALVMKDRSVSLAVVADRLVDYSPHLHLARAYHRMGNFREAFLHLGIAKNEGNASPEALHALSVLVKRDRLRPRIMIGPLPDHTTENEVTIRGVVISEEKVNRVEVAGREAILRAATASDVRALMPESERHRAPQGGQQVLFEVAGFRLSEGENTIIVRPFFRNPTRDGDVLKCRIVRLPRGDEEDVPDNDDPQGGDPGRGGS